MAGGAARRGDRCRFVPKRLSSRTRQRHRVDDIVLRHEHRVKHMTYHLKFLNHFSISDALPASYPPPIQSNPSPSRPPLSTFPSLNYLLHGT